MERHIQKNPTARSVPGHAIIEGTRISARALNGNSLTLDIRVTAEEPSSGALEEATQPNESIERLQERLRAFEVEGHIGRADLEQQARTKEVALYTEVAQRAIARMAEILREPKNLNVFLSYSSADLATFLDMFNPQVDVIVQAASAPSQAQERGRNYMDTQLANEQDNLPLERAAAEAGLSGPAINNARQAGQFYALIGPARARGYRYPRWQFAVPRERLRAVLEPFRARLPDCWAIHAFMTQPNALLEGHTPAAVIGDPRADLQPVLEAAERAIANAQGGDA